MRGAILITLGWWLASTVGVLVLTSTYVWSRHNGRRRRAREMVFLLLRRDHGSLADGRHVAKQSRRRVAQRVASDAAHDRNRSLRRERASRQGISQKDRRRP